MSDKQPRAEFHYVPYAMIPSCIVDDTRVTPAMLRVYCCAASYATEKNGRYVWGKPNEIAKRLGLTRQAVGQMVAQLEAFGYLHVNRAVYRKDGGRDANRIRLLMNVEVPSLYLREPQPRPRAGIGGRPRKVINIVDSLPPETQSLRGVKLNGVYTPETPGVSAPETPGVSAPETKTPLPTSASPHGLRREGASAAAQEDLLRGSSKRISQEVRAAPREVVSPSSKKISRAEAEQREQERLYGKRVAKGGAR